MSDRDQSDSSVADLPLLESIYDVPDDVARSFRADGHTSFRGVCSREEIEAFAPVIRDAALADSGETRPLNERDTYAKAFLQIENLWERHDAVRRFVFAPRFAAIAAALLGVEAVRLYHDQALFKEAGGGHTPWHQDQYYWPLDTDSTITMWMPLVDVPPEIGSMTFVSGSHQIGHRSNLAISDESDEAFAAMIAERRLHTFTHGAMAAGDATFHAGWTLHAAPPNPTGILRAVMTIIYFADGARVTPPKHDFQERDRRNWLGGVEPGDLAASSKNPVLWPPATAHASGGDPSRDQSS